MIGFDDPAAPNNTFIIMNEVVGLLPKNRYPGGLPPKAFVVTGYDISFDQIGRTPAVAAITMSNFKPERSEPHVKDMFATFQAVGINVKVFEGRPFFVCS